MANATAGCSALVQTYALLPITLVDGQGMRVRDADGREYWDFYGGHAVTVLGHAHPEVTAAVAEQAARMTFYSNVLHLEIRERAASRLAAFAPPGLGRIFYCNSGTEANENALKLAIQQTGRTRVTALKGGFHGRTLLALSATDGDKLRAPFASILCESQHLPANDASALSGVDERDAAVIVEPVQSLAGVVTLTDDHLAALRRRCDAVGAMLIFDEVQTGIGRMGAPFVSGSCGTTPDMMTLAKSIANGLPLGAVVMTDRVAERVKVGDLGATFGGGPVVCAAQVAVLDVIEREGLVDNARRLGEFMAARLCVGPVRRIRGRGCLLGLELDGPSKAVRERLLTAGFITGGSDDPNVIRLMPPINAPDEAVEALGVELERLS